MHTRNTTGSKIVKYKYNILQKNENIFLFNSASDVWNEIGDGGRSRREIEFAVSQLLHWEKSGWADESLLERVKFVRANV